MKTHDMAAVLNFAMFLFSGVRFFSAQSFAPIDFFTLIMTVMCGTASACLWLFCSWKDRLEK